MKGGTALLLSSTGISAYLLIALILLLAPSYLRVSQLASLTAPSLFGAGDMIALTNAARGAAGLSPLRTNAALTRAAQAKLADMFEKQYFAHESPDGTPPWTFVKQAGYTYRAAGENLAADFTRAEDAVSAFLNSPTHRANIMSPLYADIGVAVRQGTLFGRPSVLVVEYFGAPRAAASSAATPSHTTAPTRPATPPASSAGASTPVAPIAPATRVTAVGAIRVLGASAGEIPNYLKIKIFAIMLVASLVLALSLLAARAKRIPWDVGARAAFPIAVLLYAATIGIQPWTIADLTPAAAATLSP